MFGRLVGLIFLVLLAGALSSWLAAQPGMLRLEWLGWQMEMRTSFGVAILVVLVLALIFADRLFRGLLDLPAWMGRNLNRRRTVTGHRALALGLMAVSAGEPVEARRQAARAQRLLSAPQLTDLLSAQAAHLSGDSHAASRYFTSLTKDKDTAFLGYIGLARLALEDDRSADALVAAQTAFDLRPKSALAARQVLVLEAQRENWRAALPALNVVAAADDAPDVLLARQKAALLYLDALDSFIPNPDKNAILHTKAGPDVSADLVEAIMAAGPQRRTQVIKGMMAALAAWPEFWPAVLCLADLQIAARSPRKAVKPLETAFRSMPHDAIAARLKIVWKVTDGNFVSRLIRLIPGAEAPGHEARRVVAGAALDCGLVGEAKRLLGEIPDDQRDAACWRLVARLADLDDDSGAATSALRMAGDAPRPRRWQCTSCHILHEDWTSHCEGCAGFATLDWRRPDGATPRLKPPAG